MLSKLGFKEVRPNLWMKVEKDQDGEEITVFHDYRAGKRRSYGYRDGKSCDVKSSEGYRAVKAIEESMKVKTLDKF